MKMASKTETQYECNKYLCTKETLRKTLDTYGVAIVPSVLNEEETTNMVSGMWDFFEHITQEWHKPINRSDKKSWKGIHKLYPMHSMLIQYFSVGQAQVSWDLRQNPKIVDIFSEFWKCPSQDLLVSADGFSFNMPPEETNRGWNRNNTWYHTDQSFLRPEFECMQTWVTGLDVEDGDATLAFYEGSNKFHRKFAKEFNITKKQDWYKLNEDEEQFYINAGCEKKKIMCPKGSLVCWDSRTIHCGTEANRARKNPKHRAVIYLCYQPRIYTTEAQLKKKLKALEDMRTTSHWPCKVKLFGKNPRTYGNELPKITQIPPPVLTPLGRKLTGY
jgi:hypothetical protein